LVALTRERGHNEELRHRIGARAGVLELPLTATRFRPLREVDDDIHSLTHFGDFRSLVVTSARCDRYVALARDALFEVHEVFSVGPATTTTLERSGLAVTHESSGSALDLADFITKGPVLLLGAVGGRVELSEALARRSLHPRLVECYSTVDVTPDEREKEQLRNADVVFIGAPSAWRVARALVSAHVWVLVPGRTTLDVVKEDHERVLVGWGQEFESAWETVTASSV
jgi:uroporphyrinogen-III synthase